MEMNSKLLFIGGGNMAQAIIAGLIKKNYPSQNIFVVDRNENKCTFFENTYSIKTSLTIEPFLSVTHVIFLCVKPQGAQETCESIQSLIAKKNPLIISVMAGITIKKLNLWLGEHLSIIRTMPNTPSFVQKGATGLFALPSVSDTNKKMAEFLLQAIGITAWLNKESDLNIIVALSGSAPAYYFYFIELMRKISIEMGLSSEIADAFAIQTIYGVAELAHLHEKDVVELRQQVTSKKGTTDAAIRSMESNDMELILKKAMQAAINRAEELSC